MTSSQAPSSAEVVDDNRPRTIGLCVIVKDEAHVIVRCLDSVRPLVDYVLIEDTGSTDGTQDIITDWLQRHDIPGAVIQEPWRDFAYNRSHALATLREQTSVDYALIIDADDRLVMEPGFDPGAYKSELRGDLYDIQIRHGSARFYRPQLLLNRLPFCFKAVLHEYLEAPPGRLTRSNIKGFHIETGRGGARNKNPRKYEDDAAALEKALLSETDPFLISRYTFYLAQSYRDCGEHERALENYLKRAELGYWAEEVFESLYRAAKLREQLDHPAEQVIATYRLAAEASPTRAEAWHGLSRYCRQKGRNEEGYQYAQRGLAIPQPEGGLFVESWIYDFGLLDELSINAYWSGHFHESLKACLSLLEGAALPAGQRGRVLQNARFALDKLPKSPELGVAGQSDLIGRHALTDGRALHSKVDGAPKVLLAILAKQKEEMLPLYLECIEALDYPKSSISLYIRTNNNTDGTDRILREWVERVGDLYAEVEFDASDVAEPVQNYAAHEWNTLRFSVLGRIRNLSLQRARERNCAFYFVVDVDNFIRPGTLRELVALNLPIVGPLLRSIQPGRYYSNYHAEVDDNGYYRQCDQYMWILNQWIRGVHEVPVIHTTYLIRTDVIDKLYYLDQTSRHEYVIFSESARKAGIPQYIDNRQVYGYIVFGEDNKDHYVAGGVETARSLLLGDSEFAARGEHRVVELGAPAPKADDRPARARVFSCFGLHSSGSTWMYNLVREICGAASIPFVSTHRDWSANLPWDSPGQPLIIAKSHNPWSDFQALVSASSDPVVITVRDPRDAVASLMRRFPKGDGATFDKALATIEQSAKVLVAVSQLREIPVFRYEDSFVGAPETFDDVARLLGVELSSVQRDSILARLSPDGVRKTISDLESAGAIRGERVWDRETLWHANHVGDGRIGKWIEALTADQADEVMARTRDYCLAFGYSERRGRRRAAASSGASDTTRVA